MVLFAFWGRVSTEDNQDPASSRNWQLARSKALVEPRGGVIVAEFFDVDKSRSIPPQRRPEAAALLAELRNPHRGFDAVVVGEPQRAFYGNQFGNTFELFNHYGVQLWVPEVGGPIDPVNEAHELIMLMFGGISKGERNRIRIRVRTTMEAQAKIEGRFLGGRPPYGYRLVDAGPHPNPSKAADGKRLHRLEPDPLTAPIVGRIFWEFLHGQGLYLIAEGLTREDIPSPSAYDKARNRHRSGIAWSKSAVRAILLNPRYTGRQVWNKQHKQEELLDVNDVTQGHVTKLKWNTQDQWVWSDTVVHEPLIDTESFQRATLLLSANGRPATERKPRSTRRPYIFRGLLRCDVCTRRMEGTWNNGRAHYRCKFPVEYALANKIEHPRTVYVREDHIVAELDPWICQVFAPANVKRTVEKLLDVQNNEVDRAAIHAAEKAIDDCDRRMIRYRSTIDAGGDPQEVGKWMAETRAERLQAEGRMRTITRTHEITEKEVKEMIPKATEMVRILQRADPVDKNDLYTQMGLHLVYNPSERVVLVEARPSMYQSACPRGDLNPHAP
ncbi:recombinase family protein [Sphaerisporangium sp. TRM90804]|uniref:recombinase family protein n=1 Tax=Sphaerisporangium sp. TRM90804 TaxID=3031113 RepID=UPI0024479859|nr:recombinase family protein [Sphaerisporangium sp. TRM90804]MDH2426478.1 recombinase family protein [Sphaerisporangium sp. TRM90804]